MTGSIDKMIDLIQPGLDAAAAAINGSVAAIGALSGGGTGGK